MRKHIVHQRLKRNRTAPVAYMHDEALSGINGTVGRTITIHHRMQVIDGQVKSPITGRPVPVDTLLNNNNELVAHVMPRMNTGVGIEHVLLPAIHIENTHARDYHTLVDNLAPSKFD